MIEDIISVKLDEERVRKDYRWLNLGQTEGYAKTYLHHHPEEIATGLKLLGVEVTLPLKGKKRKSGAPQVRRADFVFKHSGGKNHYYLVEAKENFESRYGRIQAKQNAELLSSALESEGLKDFTITPVFVGIDWKNKRGYVAGLPPTD